MRLGKVRILLVQAALAAGLSAAAMAGSYVQQASFNIPMQKIAGMDQDGLGNIYILGQTAGSATLWVNVYQTPGITPLFSFDTGLSTAAAFAVESNGVVDVLALGSAGLFKRFTNGGSLISQASIPTSVQGSPIYSAAIDKAGARIYLGVQYYTRVYCTLSLGGSCPPAGNKGYMYEYDFQGNLTTAVSMPGISSVGGCYTPSALTVDPQGNLYAADNLCWSLLKFSSSGSLQSTTVGSQFSNWFLVRNMWTDSQSNIYLSNPIGNVEGIIKVSPALQVVSSLVVDAPVGLGWDSRTIYLTTSGQSPIVRYIYDNPPSAPLESSPLSPITQHSASTTLNWQASSDPDGDPITYLVYLGNSPNQLSFVGSTAQTSFATQPLNFGAQYYWQVVAQDSYMGFSLETAAGPIVSFSLAFVDTPPPAPTVISATGTYAEHTFSPQAELSWSSVANAYGDPIGYRLYIGTNSASPAIVQDSTATAFYLINAHSGTTYYWSVAAYDPYQAASISPLQSLAFTLQDSPPSPIIYLTTTAVYYEHTTSPSVTLAWAPTNDPDGDPVAYRLDVHTSTGALPCVQLGAGTNATLNVQLETTYYWRVSATDPYGGASTGTWQNFIVHLANQPPNPIVYTTPTSISTRAVSFLLTWQNTGDPDGDSVDYSLFISTNPSAQYLVQQGTATAYTLNFQFGATYYWYVSATDIFGATTIGALQTFLPLFYDPPPTIPANQSQTGTIPFHGLNASQSFFWQPSTDINGDPFYYALYFGTDSSHLAVISPAALGITMSNLVVNTAYYFKLVATDIYGASSPSPLNWVYFQFYDSPPGPFSVTSATGAIVTRDATQSLSWTASVDPDGDPVSYRVFTGTSASSMSSLPDTSQTSIQLTGIPFATTYYWRVGAVDPFGATTTITGGTQSFIHLFADSAPAPIVYLSTASSYFLHTSSPVVNLAWAPTSNLEGDPLTYFLSFSVSSNSAIPLNLGSVTSDTLPVQFETTYYWSVAAVDPYGGSSTGAWQNFIVHLDNKPPNPFSALSSTGTDVTRSTFALLSWAANGDPYGDTISYQLFLATVPFFRTAGGTGPAPISLTADSYTLNSITYGTTYYWSVAATNSLGAQTWLSGGTQAYLPLLENLLPVAASSSAANIPSGTIATADNSVNLVWPTYIDPLGGPVTYALYFGQGGFTSSSILSARGPRPAPEAPRTAGAGSGGLPEVYQGAQNSFTLAGLSYGVSYSYSIDAIDSAGSISIASGSFTLSPNSVESQPYNFPNPFRVSQGTDFVVTAFSTLDSVKISVYSAYQQLVWNQNFGPVQTGVHQFHWNGDDMNGRPVFSGLYVAVIQSGQGRQIVRTVGVR